MNDPIQKLEDWQLRSQNLEKIKDKVQSVKAVMEDRFVDALDEKYHHEEWLHSLIEQEEFCLNEDPRERWLTNKGEFANINGE